MIKKIRNAFTMMELIFVIIIIGLLATFGVKFMVQAYKSYLFSAINNRLQNESATAVEFIAKRLSYRINGSVIARYGNGINDFDSIEDITPAKSYTVLSWIGSDIDGWRGVENPLWSGIIDLDIDPTNENLRLVSPETNTSAMSSFVSALSYGFSNINDSALHFIGSDSDISTDYGWSTNDAYMQDQNGSMHPINNDANITVFTPSGLTDFSGVDVYEYYKHSWTAYAIVHTPNGDLTLYYNYQPWDGEKYDTLNQNIQTHLIMQNVATFKYKAIGSLIKIQVCTESDLTGEEYAICKEKTIF